MFSRLIILLATVHQWQATFDYSSKRIHCIVTIVVRSYLRGFRVKWITLYVEKFIIENELQIYSLQMFIVLSISIYTR